jgi:hypothetical protein
MVGRLDELNRLISEYGVQILFFSSMKRKCCHWWYIWVSIDGRMDLCSYLLHSIRNISELIALVHLGRCFQNGSRRNVTIVFPFCACILHIISAILLYAVQYYYV